jgi:hypothetical protein
MVLVMMLLLVSVLYVLSLVLACAVLPNLVLPRLQISHIIGRERQVFLGLDKLVLFILQSGAAEILRLL